MAGSKRNPRKSAKCCLLWDKVASSRSIIPERKFPGTQACDLKGSTSATPLFLGAQDQGASSSETGDRKRWSKKFRSWDWMWKALFLIVRNRRWQAANLGSWLLTVTYFSIFMFSFVYGESNLLPLYCSLSIVIPKSSAIARCSMCV